MDDTGEVPQVEQVVGLGWGGQQVLQGQLVQLQGSSHDLLRTRLELIAETPVKGKKGRTSIGHTPECEPDQHIVATANIAAEYTGGRESYQVLPIFKKNYIVAKIGVSNPSPEMSKGK